jgi:hypothetical protein
VEAASEQAKLVFVKGPREGEEIALTKSLYRLGSGSGCEIVLSAAEAVHAELERGGGHEWRIINRSRIGLLVNKEPTEQAQLFDGDKLQLDNEHLLELRIESTSTKEVKRQKKPKGKGGLLSSPWFWVGVVLFYTAFFTGLYVIVSPSDEEADVGLTSARALVLLCESERYFAVLGQSNSDADGEQEGDGKGNQSCGTAAALPEPLQSGGSDVPLCCCQDSRSDLEALRRSSAESEERAVLVQRLLGALHRRLYEAWLLEEQGHRRELPEAYSRIVDCFPDLELPATGFALQRRRLLREEL